MYRHNIPSSFIVSLGILGVSIIMILIMVDTKNIGLTSPFGRNWKTEDIIIFTLGVLGVFLGLSLMLKKEWARKISIVILHFTFLLTLWFVYEQIRLSYSRLLQTIGMSLIFFTPQAIVFLFLTQRRTIQEFKDIESERTMEDNNLLDA